MATMQVGRAVGWRARARDAAAPHSCPSQGLLDTGPLTAAAPTSDADECLWIKVLMYNPRDVGRAADLLRVRGCT